MLQMGDTVGPRYAAPKISAISYLFRTFSLLIMGDTERPRYTGFRGLSVRGITALQCMCISVCATKNVCKRITMSPHPLSALTSFFFCYIVIYIKASEALY